MDYTEYWRTNTFAMYDRVQTIKNLLKTSLPEGTRFVRIGSKTDGGYILADDISMHDFLISFGVEQNVDFEERMYALGIDGIHMYDYSVDGPPRPIKGAAFFKEKIGVGIGETSLHECIQRTPESVDYILKMDIEGSEWDTLAATKSLDLGKFRQITLEAHWMQNLWDDKFYMSVKNALENLRATHTPVLVHANNNVPLMVLGNSPMPMVFEVLYLRTVDYSWPEQNDPFEGLITRNDPHFPEIGLTFP